MFSLTNKKNFLIIAVIVTIQIFGNVHRINGNDLENHDLSVYAANMQDSQLRYEPPDDCNYSVRKNVEVALTCRLRTVNSEFDTTNFSVIPSDHTVSLSIQCSDDIMARSELEPSSFAHLLQLRELSLEFCKFGKFNHQALNGLTDLRNLTVRTHNINWPALNLELEPNAFHLTKNLEYIDLSMNNIWSLPENLFCSLTGLKLLNISGNRLQDINDLGFRERPNLSKDEITRNSDPILAKQNGCLLDLEMVDVSNNHFVLLPANGFGTLKRLKYLQAHNNEISMVADKALTGLKNIQVVNLSSNKIVALPSELFQDPSHSIQEIYLQNNSISVLAPGLFTNLEQLQLLDLSSNQLTSAWINHSTFTGLIRLVLLNLSTNKIVRLDRAVFNDLYTLQILNLRFNQLENIAADTFSPMNNLHTLLLSHNKIKYLDAYSLNGLYVLSLLSLDNNALTGIHPEAFRNCSALQDLNLNGNELVKVPVALKDMRVLKTVDLGENKLTQIDDPGFKGMNNVYGMRLIGNLIENITIKAFKSLPSLQILNLARNKIRNIEKGTFEQTTSIQAIRLDQNQLTEIEGLFTNMPNLLWLNVSDNNLSYFDFGHIPLGLQWLDLHKNQLENLENRYGLENELRLQTLDASFNLLTKVKPLSIPNNVELLFLNDNLIDAIEPHTFMHKGNLTRVDLYANRMTGLDIKALRLMPVAYEKTLPEFYIGGNPFICDCNIDWLQKINQITTRQYPRVMDIETIYCKLLYNRDRSYVQLVDAAPMNFLCSYKTHCFALCHCCEFDACDCEMTCPNNCTCFHDQSWSTNVVECSAAGYTEMPSNIPMDTTEVYIDGNNLGELSGHSFIGRKNLRILFANNSNIHTVYNTTFAGLRRLTILHLENNIIQKFIGNEFVSLENLLELYLQNNKISFIETHTFAEMKRIEVLRLDGNRLVNFEAWQLTANPYLVEIGLADNPWTCDCTYVNKLKIYLASNTEKIIDNSRISCAYNNATSILKDKNGTKCTLREGLPMVRTQEIEDLLPLLLAATCAFIGFFGLILGIFCYRKELKVLAHSSCFQFCYKPDTFVNEYDKDRLYDAYITYSLQDEHFVNQILAQTLENDIGYRLCLHYRDFNANAYVADTIVEAVESSRRAILVLSKNFLYNEWTRFEFKGAIHEVLKRRRKLIIVLYGDLPQRDLDADIRLYLRSNTCIEWDDKKFWQKLRIAMPHIKKNHCLAKRSAVNIYATAHNYNTAARRMIGPSANGPARLDCNNYSTIAANNCPRNCDNYESVNLNCKYNTMNERRLNDFSMFKKEQRQHEYAEPTNLLMEQPQQQQQHNLPAQHHDNYGNNCDAGVGENFECNSSSKYSSSSVTSSEHSHPSAGQYGGGAVTGVLNSATCRSVGTLVATQKLNGVDCQTSSKNSVVNTGASSLSQNLNNHRKSNINCANGCNEEKLSDNNKNLTNGDSNTQFNDKRLPQAMWA